MWTFKALCIICSHLLDSEKHHLIIHFCLIAIYGSAKKALHSFKPNSPHSVHLLLVNVKYTNCIHSLSPDYTHKHTAQRNKVFPQGYSSALNMWLFHWLCYSHFNCFSRYSFCGSWKTHTEMCVWKTMGMHWHTHLIGVLQTAHFSSKYSFVVLLIFLPLLSSRTERGKTNVHTRGHAYTVK